MSLKISNKTRRLKLASGAEIAYISRMNPRARHLRLALLIDGGLVLTRPRYVSEANALKFLSQQEPWLETAYRKIKNRAALNFPGGAAAEYMSLKEKARRVITERLNSLNAVYHFSYKSISIRKQKTRWGSCSRQGALSFNYRLIFFSPQVMDYVITHELCHLQEFNHSANFWRLVARAIPDYKARRQELKNKNFAPADAD